MKIIICFLCVISASLVYKNSELRAENREMFWDLRSKERIIQDYQQKYIFGRE